MSIVFYNLKENINRDLVIERWWLSWSSSGVEMGVETSRNAVIERSRNVVIERSRNVVAELVTERSRSGSRSMIIERNQY